MCESLTDGAQCGRRANECYWDGTSCKKQYCHTAMTAKALTCPGGTPKGAHDMHDPFQGNWNQPDATLQSACCDFPPCSSLMDMGSCALRTGGCQWQDGTCKDHNCHSVMAAKALTCDVGRARSRDDWHMPFGSNWNQPDATLKAQCCQQSCHGVMTAKALTCDAGTMRTAGEDRKSVV